MKNKIQITKKQLNKIIKEGVEKLHKKTLIENRIKEINEELTNLSNNSLNKNSEVTSPIIMKMLNGYLEAALWTEEEEIGHANIESDISNDAKIDAYKDVKKFLSQAGSLIDGIDPEQIGHDLWLTRNGHGAGFFDRGLGEVGDKLSDIAREMGEKNLYIGDDGQIHIQ